MNWKVNRGRARAVKVEGGMWRVEVGFGDGVTHFAFGETIEKAFTHLCYYIQTFGCKYKSRRFRKVSIPEHCVINT